MGQETLAGLESREEVLMVHDTIDVVPESVGERIQEFAPLNTSRKGGFLAHVSLAIRPVEVASIVGLSGLKLWTRGKKEKKEVESSRWAEQMLATQQGLKDKGVVAVHIADREATLQISARRVTVQRAGHADRNLPAQVEVHLVRVYEENSPRGQKPVEWFLVTSEPIDTNEEIEKIVDSYRSRWVIEEFFKALKTGCNLERRLLESADAWYKTMTLFLPIAYRLYNLKTLGEDGSLPAHHDHILTETQLKILRTLAQKKGRNIRSLHDAKMEIAALGGHIKYNGRAGWAVLARGYLDLLQMEWGWKLAKNGAIDP